MEEFEKQRHYQQVLAWRRENPEKVKIYNDRYYSQNSAAILERAQEQRDSGLVQNKKRARVTNKKIFMKTRIPAIFRNELDRLIMRAGNGFMLTDEETLYIKTNLFTEASQKNF